MHFWDTICDTKNDFYAKNIYIFLYIFYTQLKSGTFMASFPNKTYRMLLRMSHLYSCYTSAP